MTATEGGNRNSNFPTASSDRRWVLFESEASDLVANDTNNASDLFLRDLMSGTTTLLSVTAGGTGAGMGASTQPHMSPDGRFIVFESEANELVHSDTNLGSDVVWIDRQTSSTLLASTEAISNIDGARYTVPTVSSDGAKVYFLGSALRVGNFRTNTAALFVRDITERRTLWVSQGLCSVADNYAVSQDGRCVAFLGVSIHRNSSLCWCLVTETTNRIVASGTNFDLSVPDFGSLGIRTDGSKVAFAASVKSSAAGSASKQIYVWDSATGTSVLASADLENGGPANGLSDSPTLSGDGTKVAFSSSASNLVAQDTQGRWRIYLRDLREGSTRLVGKALDTPESPKRDPLSPFLSFDGSTVGFNSAASLVPDDANEAIDVFAVNFSADASTLVLTAVFQTSPPRLVIRFEVAGSSNYRLQFKAGLNDPAWIDLPDAPDLMGRKGSFSIVLDPSASRFYPLKVAN